MYSKHNTTVMGQKLPSPTPLNDILTTSGSKATTSALLHSAYTRVGRAVLFLCLAALPLFMGSCQQDEAATEDALHADMLQYFAESRGLAETSADSVCNYYTKFASFHNQHPECEADELFSPIVENLGNAFTQYGIVQIGNIIVKIEWDGEIFINF